MMTLPAVTAASAEEPTISPLGAVVPGEVADGVHGTVWIDLNGDGAQNDNVMGTTGDFGDPNVAGAGNESAGRAGVKIALLDGSGAIVAETTTDATGAYTFAGLADGNYTVRAISPSLNYRWIMPSTSHSDFVGQAEAPPALHTALAPVTVTGGQSPSANGGLRPIPAFSVDLYDTDPNTPGVQGILTGSKPLDPNGICPVDEPGNDCSRTDNRVATNDTVTVNYSINTTSMQEGAGSAIEPVGDVILEVLLHSTDGAVPTFEVNGVNNIPTACRQDRSVKSQIITEANGDVRLICNVGLITQGGNSKYTLNLVPSAASPNGSTFTASAVAYSAINDAIPSEQFDVGPFEVSAAPRFNLAKRSDGAGDPSGGNQPIGGVVPMLNPVTGKVEDSIVVAYTAVIEAASADVRGQQSLTPNVSFTDKIDPRYAQYGAAPAPSSGDNRCREMTTYYAGKFGLPSFVSSSTVPGNNQMRSGTYSCNGFNQATGEFKVNVSGMDSSLQYVPQKSYDGKINMEPHRLVSAGVVTVVYPISAIMKANIPGWKDGDPIVGDKYPVTNCYTNFDPSSSGGVSNFGAGFEPGWDGTTASGDNCQTHQIVIAANGSVVKSYGKIPASGDPLTEQSIGAPTESLGAPSTIIPTSRSSWGSGDGMTTMDEEMYTYVGINNTAGTLALPDAQVCDVWDNSVQTLGAFSGGPSAGLLTSLSYSISGTGEQFDAFDPASRGYYR
ncbi:SdrD B-like domain-containing protein [Lysinibacter cavernae]|uniref:SD-repeat containing protein B domain-containing protein n=1 Tax=Lysinibacter cavernae TaxID=1640652 RepID=A0A7X5R1K8_9MICO|nr:SdrD B-like domain-containing protein [Lysinibacter cavernae]NIH53690.1 hypothetical protein [Lysinibacter cavernae]